MGNYINANLTKEEHVVYEAHYHWSIWLGSLIGASFFFVPMRNLLIEAMNQHMSPAPITWVLMIIGFLILFFTYLKVVTDEFASKKSAINIDKRVFRISPHFHLSIFIVQKFRILSLMLSLYD